MKVIDGYEFPETQKEMEAWLPYVRTRALSGKVLAVMRTRCEVAWSAYIDAVPGRKHDDEKWAVLDYGEKLPKSVAMALFTMPNEIRYDA